MRYDKINLLNKKTRRLKNMQMTFRWFGSDKDTVTLSQIKQIPGVTGVVPALHYLPA